MTIHQPISHANRRALPRSLIARARRVSRAIWTFHLGQIVEFDTQKAVVIGRQRSARGREKYDLITTSAEGPFRCVPTSMLKASGATPTHLIHGAFHSFLKLAVDEYAFEFAIGQNVLFQSTGEAATIVGRSQVSGCVDQYVIEFEDADRDPLTIQDFQICAVSTEVSDPAGHHAAG